MFKQQFFNGKSSDPSIVDKKTAKGAPKQNGMQLVPKKKMLADVKPLILPESDEDDDSKYKLS